MNKTELAIIEQLAQLNEAEQQQLLELARRLVADRAHHAIALAAWLDKATAFRQQLKQKYGPARTFDTQALLDELREEVSWPRG